MEELDKESKLIMWSKINELISDGLNFSQISRKLHMNRQTVSLYASMSLEEFMKSRSYQREYAHKLDVYEDYVLALLRKYPFVSSAQVHDRLREHHPEMQKVSEKTVFNFVRRLRLTHDIPKEEEDGGRQMCKLPETDYGECAQVDFGEKWMPRAEGDGKVKVYFMLMVLSRSRYKFVHFSLRPFTSETAVYAHQLAFAYYGGKPKELVYDQDRVFIKDENLGDYRLTARFGAFCSSERIVARFCRKGDPQSKGKVENGVKYVKNNFLSAREFKDIDTLNKEGLEWLGRTANGTEHRGIRAVPADVFAIEREWLTPYGGTPVPPEDTLEARVVRKDNTILFKGAWYSVPCGTYAGHGTEVYAEERDGAVHVYSKETGKTICQHPVAMKKGETVSNANHMRSPGTSLDDYRDRVLGMLPANEDVRQWMESMREERGRYFRDSLKAIERQCWQYTPETLETAFTRCLELGVYNANVVMEIAESERRLLGLPRLERPVDMEGHGRDAAAADMTPQRSSISTYQDILDKTT